MGKLLTFMIGLSLISTACGKKESKRNSDIIEDQGNPTQLNPSGNPPTGTTPVDPQTVYDFEGTVALSNCSGSLVRFDDSQDSEKALILSNGHCVSMMDPDKAYAPEPSQRSFGLLNKDAAEVGRLQAETLLYATMKKTDVSLFQVTETYEQIRSRYHIEALTLSRQGPAEGDEIEIISGFWKRGFHCQIEHIVENLKEDKWSWTDSLRYSHTGCETFGGTSGSPVLIKGSRSLVAIHNTHNDNGQRCELNNPCEVESDGTVIAEKGFRYAQQTAWFYTCRNPEGRFDSSTEGCLLPRAPKP